MWLLASPFRHLKLYLEVSNILPAILELIMPATKDGWRLVTFRIRHSTASTKFQFLFKKVIQSLSFGDKRNASNKKGIIQ